MRNDIIPPRRPSAQQPLPRRQPVPMAQPIQPSSPAPVDVPASTPPVVPPSQPAENPTPDTPPVQSFPPKKSSRKPLYVLAAVLGTLVLLIGGVVALYLYSLQPVSGDAKTDNIRVTVVPGSTPSQIGQLLEDEQIIRSGVAFDVYTRLNDIRGTLKAGDYSLSPAESTAQIAAHLTKGSSEEYSVTFYPGATLNLASTEKDGTPSHRQVLENLGFTTEEIDEAFTATYDHPLLADKPAEASLEGYVYGQTYQVANGSSAKQILTRTFDEYYAKIQENKLLAGFEKQNLDLHQAIILASIIQREVSGAGDQKQVAQVFYKRLSEDMQLGADATFIYGARLLDVAPTVDLDSPYNTRRYTGLPPGPISSPGLTALQAVAAPAKGDYLYFVSGDDGTNYFSRTLDEHEAKTRQYCQANCSLF